MQGIISNIQRFSLHDGPGVRTTVFFKGCPLRCIWCHNPETYQLRLELVYHAEKCISCGDCLAVCKTKALFMAEGSLRYHEPDCKRCFSCSEICPSGALSLVGNEYTVQQVLQQVLEDKGMYAATGGGITVSGGEPTLQHGFVLELLKAAKAEGLHTALDTCGYCSPDILKELVAYTDLVLYDLKCADSHHHQELTGKPNEEINANLLMLDALGTKTEIRIPVIPSMNDDEENIGRTCEIIRSLKHINKVILLGYHRLGLSKLVHFDQHLSDIGVTPPNAARLRELTDRFRILLPGALIEYR